MSGPKISNLEFDCPKAPPREVAASYYDARAEEYDQFYTGEGSFEDIKSEIMADHKAISAMIESFALGSLLDVACGTSYYSQTYSKGASSVTGVDISRRMLSESRKRHLALGVKSSLIRADSFMLPLAAGKFDRCFIGFLLSHLSDEDIVALIKAISPLMKADGKIAIVDSAWTEMRSRQSRKRSSYQTRTLDDGREFSVFKRYFTLDELNSLMKCAGYSRTREFSGQLFLSTVCSPSAD
ncbi:MAG: class I SAM-dependent methyltransferase [Candidatus Coatesbacteria bacterium]|nr:class I SAM-dependent methyltransferase [Candidatus Coatesbacteria bacterium]